MAICIEIVGGIGGCISIRAGACEPHLIDIAGVPIESFAHGERFGMSFQCLSAFGGGTQITVCTEVLVPGRQASQAHYHMLEDEHVLILEGSLTVRLGEKNFVLSRGLYACWDGVAF